MVTFHVPGYTGLTLLREGGGAWVLRGEREADGAPVAVKVLQADAARNREMVAAFRREARLLARLDCPTVVTVHEYVRRATPQPAMVMEYVRSENLKRLIYDWRPFVCEHWHRILLDTAAALACIHRKRIIHRDVKPENVLVAPDGSARLVDFSLAWTRPRRPKKIQGTPRYISPEAISRARVTAAADIYGFGVLAYEVLAGETPFGSDDTGELLRQHLEKTPRPLAELAPTVPPDLAAHVMQMLAKRPADRPAGMADVVAALERTVRSPLPAPPAKNRSDT